MTAPPSRLVLVPATFQRTAHDGNVVRHPESHYLDFLIDGRSLAGDIPESRGLVTLLNRPWLATIPDAVENLCARKPDPDLAPGRVMLLVCGWCGDLRCGAVTAALEVGDLVTTWSDFRWEDGHASGASTNGAPEQVTFSTAAYLETLRAAAERVAEMPHDELAHRSRRFLWPWQWGWLLLPAAMTMLGDGCWWPGRVHGPNRLQLFRGGIRCGRGSLR